MDLEKKIENIANAIRIANNEIKTMSLWVMPENIEKIEGMPSAYIVERLANEIELASFNTITSIGDYAFYNYANLENISFPNSVETIGTQVLKGCNNLESVSIPFVGSDKDGNINDNFGYLFGGVSIYDNGANVPTSLKEVKITGETPIGDGAFYDCKDITKVDMQESLIKDIGILAFYGCTSLENVSLPYTIENVGLGAFYGLNNLNYTIVDGIKYLGNKDNPYLYCEGDRLNLTRTSVNIQEGCKIIGAGAFIGCVLVSNLTIPSSVEYIGDYAFRSCSRLSNVSFVGNSKLKRIGRESFRDCKGVAILGGGITSITIPDSVEFIDRGAFRGCDKLTSITLPFVGRTAAANERHCHFGYIFGANGYGENSTYIPNGLSVWVTNATNIGDYAFYNCRFSDLTLNKEIEYIGKGAFDGSGGAIDFGDGQYYIKAYYGGHPMGGIPFVYMGQANTELFNLDIPDTCKFIYGLSEYSHLVINKFAIPNSVIGFQDSVSFRSSDIDHLNTNTYKPSENSIATYYLGNLTNPYLYLVNVEGKENYDAETVEIANGCRFIGSAAFIGARNLTVKIPKSVKYIGERAFSNWSGSLIPENGSTFADYEFTRIGNFAFSNESGQASSPNAILDAKIKHIGYGAFMFNTIGRLMLTTNIKGTETIDGQAFYTSYFNGGIDLSQTKITSLPDLIFKDAKNLKGFVLPDTLEYIGSKAFENCWIYSESITIPKNVISIGNDAFKNCKINGTNYDNPRKVFFCGTVDQWATIEFSNASSSPIRHGDQGAGITLYIKTINNSNSPLTTDVFLTKAYKISDYAFYDYRNIKVVNIPNTVTSIGESAFENTWIERVYVEENTLFDFSKLALGGLSDYITLDEDVGKIKDYAFYNNRLIEFTIPSGCKAIGKKAFNYTSGQTQTLKTLYVKAETPPTLADDAIPDSVTRIEVPQGKLSAYQSATNWSVKASIMVEE